MGPEDTLTSVSDFTDKVPPSFDGRSNYASYREDVQLWTKLTSLATAKQGPALVGRLSGEAKASAKSLSIDVICDNDGVEMILKRLDKSYAVDAANQLDSDLAVFLDYSWKKSSSVEQYIAGFHSRLDKIASLEIDEKLKGHLLLRQASLSSQEKNMLVGAASGSYDISKLTAAMRNAYINSPPTDSTMNSQGQVARTAQTDASRNSRRTDRSAPSQQNTPVRPTFYTFKTSTTIITSSGAVLDSGACASVVGKKTLDKTLISLGIQGIPDATPARDVHRFGNHPESHATLCAVKFPFSCS